MDIVKLQPGTLLHDVVKAVGSKKRKAILSQPRASVTISGTYWSEGSRSDWFLVNLANKRAAPLGHQAPPQYNGMRQDPIQLLEPGYALVDAGIFCGKPATPVVYFHPDEKM